ncbi:MULTISPECIES: FAD-dependent oxidoreductase [unclassified Streptomyces]|uniref:FAD-dependent oxidoreductase n=1 Tax=unclassified Streptomyces TaxID=2593676 RepID=UPI0016607364|nr:MULTISPECIES: FAD-dependent oxidoreductase [unclassified Streptomyces]MBD0708802.1 oxidoreductase [Streptomyces sp. CBMA291]MBD0714740.1 oxidoreductase [Streptomyces sp. CBMA370]
MNRTVDVLVVGAGPAGLAAATGLAAAGAGRVEVLERERTPGGVPRHCVRPGFGADLRGRPLDGPAFARRAVRAALRAGATVRTGVSATGWTGPLTLDVTAPTGLETIRARAVVLATGARERPRSARLVPGSRPAGVLTTGELQQLVPSARTSREPVGRRAVVVGGDPVARGAVRTLRAAGIDVVAVVCERPARHGAFGPVPVLAETVVTELHGRGRLTGVAVRGGDGRTGVLRCDTVVFTGDWIPDHELARACGLPLAPGTRGPVTDGAFRTAEPGVFAVGSLLHGGESARTAAAEGRAVTAAVLGHLAGRPWPEGRVPITAAGALHRVTPGLLGPDPVPLLVRPQRRLVRPVLTVAQDGVPSRRERLRGTLDPGRPVRLGEWWTSGVDLAGGPVVLGTEE